MALPIKVFVLRFLLLLLLLLLYTTTLFSSGEGENIIQDDAAMNPTYISSLPHQDGKIWNMRKQLMGGEDTMLDYDDTGPNPKHDPRKGGGGGGRTAGSKGSSSP